MIGHPDPDFRRLFQTYTASADSIGAHLGRTAERATATDPLLVATGTDLALYPGGGQPPTIEGFRVSTRGFTELAAISHLGPAMATLARLRQADPAGPWRSDAERLLAACAATRSANSAALWAERIGVAAFAGRESAIADMVDYGCRLTERTLRRALADEHYLTDAALRQDYLDGPAADLPVGFNRIMVGTFFLTGMDLAHRLLTWFDGLDLPWERTMVIIAGRQGRPTSGVTRDSNSVAAVIQTASRGRLPAQRLLIAPHAPVFGMFDGADTGPAAALEPDYRLLWSSILATVDLGERMFAGYPGYEQPQRDRVRVDDTTRTVAELPHIAGPADWPALTTRLRVVLEDPRQLLSGAVTDYAARQLVANGNVPGAVTVPGLDHEPYPQRRPAPAVTSAAS